MDIERFKTITALSLEVTDAMGLHREAVSIPLDFDDDGGQVRLAGPGKLEIIGPAEGSIDDFIAILPDMLAALDLSGIPKAD